MDNLILSSSKSDLIYQEMLLKSFLFDETADLEGDSNIKSKDLFHDCNIKAKDEGLDLKWNSFMAQIRETRDLATREKPAHQKIAGNNTISKWSSFMTAEDDDSSDDDQKVESRKKREGDHISQLWMNDERVEEDVHPDFL